MTKSAARFIADRLGKGSKLIRGGNEGGPTPNDGIIDVAGSGNYMRFPGVAGYVLKSTPDTDVTVTHDSIEVAYRFRPLEATQHMRPVGTTSTHLDAFVNFSSGQCKIYYLDEAASAIGNVHSPDPIPGYTVGGECAMVGDWIWVKQKLTRSTALCEYWYSFDQVTDEANAAWLSLGTVVGANAGNEFHPAALAFFNVGSFTTGFTGGEMDVQFARQTWAKAGQPDTVRTWSALTPGAVAGEVDGLAVLDPGGSGFKARLVEDRNIANLDGTDDFWDCDLDAPVDDELAGVMAIERLTATTALGTLVSTEESAVDGFRVYSYQSTTSSVGKLVAVYRSPTHNAVIVTNLASYTDGERFAMCWRIGDYNGNRTFSFRTNREGWKRTALNSAVGDVTHRPWRIGARAYALSASHPMGFTELVPYTFAPSEDNLDVALTAVMESAGKPV